VSCQSPSWLPSEKEAISPRTFPCNDWQGRLPGWLRELGEGRGQQVKTRGSGKFSRIRPAIVSLLANCPLSLPSPQIKRFCAVRVEGRNWPFQGQIHWAFGWSKWLLGEADVSPIVETSSKKGRGGVLFGFLPTRRNLSAPAGGG
jgi:hypothetical protein